MSASSSSEQASTSQPAAAEVAPVESTTAEAAVAAPQQEEVVEVPAVPIQKQTEDGKHILQTSWTLWYDKYQKEKNVEYKDQLQKIGTFTTVEDFLSYYTHVVRPSSLQKNSNFHLFRDNTLPMWESYPHGGCWIVKMKKNSELLDRIWEQLIFSVVGEEFEEPELVGVGLSIKQKEDIISIWNSDNRTSQRSKNAIGAKLKYIMHLAGDVIVSYKVNKKSMKDGSTYKNAKAFIVGNEAGKKSQKKNKSNKKTKKATGAAAKPPKAPKQPAAATTEQTPAAESTPAAAEATPAVTEAAQQ